ncbi:MAG: FeoB-associated Cys-rich membrane protein [Ruminococcaceae bacterium]|jgi:hypothetical protein|nr:FeoB-associated Cys-rich membrane protein [Oscillospiraceae bacterium]
MLQFIQTYGGTVAVVAFVAFIVFLAIRRLVLDKKEGIGPCGQKCSHCANAGHCDLDSVEDEVKKMAECGGVCSGCKYSATCHKNSGVQ